VRAEAGGQRDGGGSIKENMEGQCRLFTTTDVAGISRSEQVAAAAHLGVPVRGMREERERECERGVSGWVLTQPLSLLGQAKWIGPVGRNGPQPFKTFSTPF
jgi:hypothetical protein